MGIYQASLVIPAHPPSTLPRLCVVVEAQTPIDAPFKKLSIELRMDDKIIEQMSFPEESLTSGPPLASPDGVKPVMILWGTIFVLQSISVEKSSVLSVVAKTESEEFLSNILHINFASQLPNEK